MNLPPPIEKRISLPWGKLTAKVWGQAQGALPIVALHGWLDNANSFDPLIPLLNYPGQIVALDLAGHGLSDHRPNGGVYHFVDGVTDLIDAVHALGYAKCILMGHSLGSALSSFVTAYLPEVIAAAVFIEALGPFVAPPENYPDQFRKYLAARLALETKSKPLYPTKDRAIEVRLTVGDMQRKSVQILCDRGLTAQGSGFTWRSDPRLRLPSPLRLTEPNVIATLSEIRCPSLLIRGKQGLAIPSDILSGRKVAIKNLRELVVAGGHHLHMDNPEIIVEPLRHFLKLTP